MDPAVGLTGTEVEARHQRFGYNEITAGEEPLWHRVFRRFWGPIPWMIEIAAILSAVVGKWEDFIIITIMLLVNAGLDFFQEHRALNALKALKQRLKAEVIVLRDGGFKTIPARELVPGDIVRLRIGNIVPADVQLLEGDYLSLDQSALTGESLPVNKKADEVAYASTIVKQGEMLAVVVNTGTRTNFHSVVALVARASLEERSHFQKMVIRIGDFLILITVVLVVLIVMVSSGSLGAITTIAAALVAAIVPRLRRWLPSFVRLLRHSTDQGTNSEPSTRRHPGRRPLAGRVGHTGDHSHRPGHQRLWPRSGRKEWALPLA